MSTLPGDVEDDAGQVTVDLNNAALLQETLDDAASGVEGAGQLSGTTRASPLRLAAAASAWRTRDVVEIGHGGMGAVSSAFDGLLLRRFARKTMNERSARSPASTLRFIEEAQITAQLDHPNIVPVHDLATDPETGELYFTMKLVDGETLSSVFLRLHAKPFSGTEFERVLRIFLKVCDAISFAHSRGVVHRDLKPDNIMVGSHGQVYVMDWGVALLLERERGSSGAATNAPIALRHARQNGDNGRILGTVSYMAPEQAAGNLERQSVRTDVYGLGAILYCMLTGTGPNVPLPHCADLLSSPDPQARGVWPSLPPGLCRITMRALEPEPSDRYASVDELKHDIEGFLRGGGWFQTRVFPAGSVIMQEGDESDSAFIVLEGRCRVQRSQAGSTQVVREVGEGEIFGETGLLTRRPRTASVVALSDVRAMLITPDALHRELQHSEWMRVLVEALAERFRELDQAQVVPEGGAGRG